jgi:hypothetical protein
MADPRTASFVVSINEVAVIYEDTIPALRGVQEARRAEGQKTRRLRIDFAPTAREAKKTSEYKSNRIEALVFGRLLRLA